LKKVPNLQEGERSCVWKGFFILTDTAILLYQIIICVYFVLLTNQSVSHNTLNSYLKLLFVLFIFKILGSSCQKYLKKLLLCVSLFAVIVYDWYVFIVVILEKSEKDTYFDFFMIVFIFTQGFFLLCSYILYKEWNIYRFDLRRPRQNFALNMNVHEGAIKVGLTDEEINCLKIEILQKSFENSEKIVCTICTFDVNRGDEVLKISCGHIFHSKCLVPWLQLNKACPNCRRDLIISQGLQREVEAN
jgi:hypothetical protein